jgi:uncharacterized membrane protein
MPQYELILKNEKAKFYQSSMLLIILLSILSFIFLAYYTNDLDSRRRLAVAAIAIILYLIFDQLTKNRYNLKLKPIALIYAFYTFIRTGYYIPAIALLILMLFYYLSIRELIVKVNKQMIYYPSFPKKEFNWNQLNNVLLKDEILTIDFKNNKLFQQNIDPHLSRVNEAEFNEFCKQQLSK